MSDDRSSESERRSADDLPLRDGADPSAEFPADPSQSVEFVPGGEPTFLPPETPPPKSRSESTALNRNRPDLTPPAQGSGRSAAASGGSSWRGALPGDSGSFRAANSDDRTQISKRPPLAPAAANALRINDSHAELEGERLEHFELQELVGGGGMGAVFRALDTRLNRVVALKILAQNQAIDEEKIRRFRNEAQSAARLDHEHVARVYYVGEDRGLHFIAFEFIAGTNIRDLVETRGQLPIGEAITYAYQIAEALAHASSRDVVHRDIKPSNVIITEQGRAKLVDLGLARLHDNERSGTDLTASGVTLGTFDYISPEQALDPRNADSRSDIYSLGCTLYFMLTGQPPFPEGTPLQKLLHHHSEKPPDARELNATIPDDLASLVQRMMAKDPSARPATPTALVRELVQLAHDLDLPMPTSSWSYPPPRRRWKASIEKQLPWLVPVAALLLIVAILEGLAIWPIGGASVAVGPTTTPLGRPTLAPPGGPASISPPRGDSSQAETPSGSQPDASTTNQPATVGKSTPNHATASPTGEPGPSIAVPPMHNRSTTNGATAGSSRENPPMAASSNGSPSTAAIAPNDTASSIRAPLDKRAPAETTTTSADTARATDPRDSRSRDTTAGVAAAAGSGVTPFNVTSPADAGALGLEGAQYSDPTRPPDANATASGFDGGAEAIDPFSVLAPAFDPVGAAVTAFDAAKAERQNVASLPTNAQGAGRPGLRIVDPTQNGPYVYATLRAACAAAQDGDVIELRYDGVREERPLESRNRRLTIRAAENHHPVVRFTPTEVDFLKHPRQMITVAGGRLTLVHLTLELNLTLAMPAEGWALFEIQQAELVRLEDCALTIRNTSERGDPQHADVSFFEINAPPGAATMVMAQDPPPLPTSLELQDSIARGEGVFLRVSDLQPVSLAWHNGFLATSQRLLIATGGAKEPLHAGRWLLDLRHLTAAARDGLVQLANSADAPYQLPTEIRCSDSIVVAGSQGALIEQSGIDTVADFRARLKWESDRNFYDGFSVFWKVRGKSALAAVEEMTLSPWNAFWGGRERSWGQVIWRETPDLARPPHLQTVADFALDDSAADNHARRGASDGRDVGCEAALLPNFGDAGLQGSLRTETPSAPRAADNVLPPRTPSFR